MSVLSDRSLRTRLRTGGLGIEPQLPGAVQPASVDLTLGYPLRVQEYGVSADPECDQADTWHDLDLAHDGRWWLDSGRLYHGVTAETLNIPDDCLGLLSGTSTNARLGLMIHVTGGLLDPGYGGRPTLEIIHFGHGIRLRPGMVIAQVAYFTLDQPAAEPYGHPLRRSRYQGDTAPTPARMVP